MSGVRGSVDVRGIEEVRRRMRLIEQAGRDLTPALRDIGEHLLNSMRERFSSETGPDGDPWEPLSERYRSRKRRNADKILTLYGDLRGRLAYQVDPSQVEVGTNLVYAAPQNFGWPEKNIPARTFVGLSREDDAEVLDILQDHFSRALRS